MNHKKWLLLIIGMLGVCIYVSIYAGSVLLELAQDPHAFKEWIASYGIFAQVVMVVLVFLQVVFAWLPGEVFEVVAGYVFGFWQGTILILFASFCASACIMILVKNYGHKLVSLCFSKNKLADIAFLQDTKRLDKFIAIAFLIPGSPKDILTYAIGLTKMKISSFLCISTLARIPSVITSTLTGSALGVENYQLALYSFIFTSIISCLGLFIYRMIAHTKHIQVEENVHK